MAPRRRRNVPPPISPVVDVVGGWLGGRRGSSPSTTGITADARQREIDPRGNQTQLLRDPHDGEFYPRYPNPQPIRNMPFQNAGYDDAFNVQGKRASTENVTQRQWHGQQKAYIPESMEKFFNDVETVYINPTYMYNYIDPPGTADRKEKKAEDMRGLTNQLPGFAEANSKYFNKKFQVLKAPKRGSRGTENIYEGKYSNPTKTLQLDVASYNNPMSRAIAVAPMSFRNSRTKPRGVDKETPSGPYSTNIHWNTAATDFRYYNMDVQPIMQHEFGHTLGRDHSTNYDDWDAPDKNTVLSYDGRALEAYSSRLGPSDINYYKEVQATLAKEKAERIRARNNARIAKNRNKRIR